MGMVEVLQALFVVRVVSGDEFSKKCVSVHGSWCIKVEVIMNGYRDQDMHLFATKVACASCGGMLKVCSMFVQILGEGGRVGDYGKKKPRYRWLDIVAGREMGFYWEWVVAVTAFECTNERRLGILFVPPLFVAFYISSSGNPVNSEIVL